MPDAMKIFAVVTTVKALANNKKTEYHSIAQWIKKEFNEKKGMHWHCIIIIKGGFGVMSVKGHYIRLIIGEYEVIIFKSH